MRSPPGNVAAARWAVLIPGSFLVHSWGILDSILVQSRKKIPLRRFAPYRRRRRSLRGLLHILGRVLRGLDGVFEIFLVRFALHAVRGKTLQVRQELLDSGLQRFHAVAD